MNAASDAVTAELDTIDNAAWAQARPEPSRLSVLIPFFRDDPSDLIRALDREAPRLRSSVEIVSSRNIATMGRSPDASKTVRSKSSDMVKWSPSGNATWATGSGSK